MSYHNDPYRVDYLKIYTQLICEKPCRHISYARLHSMAGLSAVTMSSIARIMLEMYFALLK